MAASLYGCGDGAQDLTTIRLLVVKDVSQLADGLHLRIVFHKTNTGTGEASRQYGSEYEQ